MPLPTPAEQTATYPLPKGWQNLPTTDASEAVTVAVVQQKYGAQVGGYFKQWYDAARKKDPGITPNQAAVTFVAGYAVAKGTGRLAAFLTGGTANISAGNINLGSVSQGPGVAQAAAKAAESLYPSSPGGSSSACALHIPGFSAGPVNWGGWCVISKTALRAFVGGSLMVAGGIIGLAGTIIAASHAFSNTSTGRGVVAAGTSAFGVAGAPGRALNSRLMKKTSASEADFAAQDAAAEKQAASEVAARREERAEEAHAERLRVSQARTPVEG